MRFDKTVIGQIRDNKTIPVIIINYNQLFYLQQLVDFLLERKFTNIVIIDNASTYEPLLDYYEKMDKTLKIERMTVNEGHKVFFKNKNLQKKYGQGFYFLTDSDILPNSNLPKDFDNNMLQNLLKYYKKINKVGFAIDTESIPDYYPLKSKVAKWEARFWSDEIEKNLYFAYIDTTFALYKPKYPSSIFKLFKPMTAIRMAGDFTCKHGGWYIDPRNLTEENLYYIETANRSASWRVDEVGKHQSTEYNEHLK